MQTMADFTDDDFRRTILRSIRLLAILTAVGVAVVWLRFGWQSALLLLIGAVISGSGLYEWLRLMTAVMARMDAGATPKPLAGVLVTFFLRLALTVVVLYVSLTYLQGSAIALAAGFVLGVVSLAAESLRLLKAWTY
jgi:hypothetical protein